MDEQAMPQMQLLLRDEQVRDKIILLTPTHYQEAIEWIRRHFKFGYGQQIDWSHDANAVTGNMQDLRENALLQLLRQYDVEPTRTLTIIWANADIGVKLPLSLIARYIHAIWLPVIDDVFVLDMHDTWCLEMFHEGNFSCGRYEKKTWLLETGRHRQIPAPSWEQIRDAILEMDGVHVNEVEITREEIGSLIIGGGNNNHYLVVYLPIDNSEENYSRTLVDPSLTGPDVTIIVQTPAEYPARMAVPLSLVLQVVEHFYCTTTLAENRYWEP